MNTESSTLGNGNDAGDNELGRLRASMRRYREADEVDAVVIGTGAGGAPLVAKLAAAGRSVVALEAGPWWTAPAQDFAADEPDAAKIYWTDERLTAGAGPAAYGGNTSGTGVGGSTLHWGAFVPRADPRDLRLLTESGVGADWPLTYEELVPFYEEVERFLGVSGPASYPWEPRRSYPLPPIPVNAPGQLMQRGFAALGVRTSEAPIAALSRDYTQPEYGLRHACVNRGFCHQGCRNGAKATMDTTYLPWAVRQGAEIRPDCFVAGIEQDASGRVTGVVYQEGPERIVKRQRCQAVILCAGAVETPRLLLHTGLGNANGQIGRHFMAHVATQVWGTFAEPVRMNKGFPATVISEDPMRPAGADFAGGYLVQSLGVVPVTFANAVARGRGLYGRRLVDYLDRYNFVAGLGVNGEVLPTDGNHISLADETDERGVPRVRITFSYGKNENALRAHGVDLMTRAWQAAGATDIWTLERSAHTIGTCRMGRDPERSVVDAFGRSHQVPNLWVCDNSVFPSSLAANPGLTIMALSLRTAEAFLRGGQA